MYPLTLKYVPTNLAEQKVTKVEESFIVLDEAFLHFKAKFYATEPKRNVEWESDASLGWNENVFNYFEIFMARMDVVQIEKAHNERSDVWCLCVFCRTYADPLKIYTKTEERCDQLLKAVKEWRWPAGVSKTRP